MAPVHLSGLLILLGHQLVSALPAPNPTINQHPTETSYLGYNPTNVLDTADTHSIQFSYAPGQTNSPNDGASLNFIGLDNPQPIRGSKGGDDPGPRTEQYDVLNPDALAPPTTDHGSVDNAQWPLGLSHVKLGLGRAGWSRQQNEDQIPAATEMAGVDMRLEPGGYRELHWHKAAEWSLVLNGTVRVQAVNEEGQTFVDDLEAGDVWFFPPGVPHSLQALDQGVEFLLVFDDGSFSEDNTFLASEIFAYNPISVLAKDLQVPESAFKNIPAGQLFIFPGTPAPSNISEQNVTGSAGIVPFDSSYSYHFSKAPNTYTTPGGTVKIVDPTVFPIASGFSAALVTIKPGAMREIHWHTTSDEWNYFLAGSARIGIYAAEANSQTFDYHAGSTGYIQKGMTHYIENIGDDDVVFLEVLQADHFSDISLGQWLALTPSQIVMDTVNLTAETVSQFKKEKQYIVMGGPEP